LLLVAELTFAGTLGSRLFSVAPAWIVVATIATALLIATPGKAAAEKSGASFYVAIFVAFVGIAALMSAKIGGFSLPQVRYGEALREITALETGMLEKGLADLKSLVPNSKPFLQLDTLNFSALVLSLMAGMAVMPHIAGCHLALPNPRDAQFSAAWTTFFVFLLLVTTPAIAAYAKLEIYTNVAKSTPLNELPSWMEAASRLDLVRIHGVSLMMLEDTMAATNTGTTDVQGVTQRLNAGFPATATAWSHLKDPVKSALLGAAKNLAASTPDDAWREFRSTVLPAAALASGNKTGLLTHGALSLEPASVIVAAAALATASPIAIVMLAAGIVAALLATTSTLLRALGTALAPNTSAARESARTIRMGTILAAAFAATVAIFYPPEVITAVVSAFSIAAAGLFPALALGLWWRRANTWGAAAGMIAGLTLTLFYIVGTQVFPVQLYEGTRLSNASDAATRKFDNLQSAWTAAADEDAKSRTMSALKAHARGTPWRPGVANWYGINGASGAVFGLPAGFLAIFLLGWLSPRSGRRS
jgi:cation/acetate symporter